MITAGSIVLAVGVVGIAILHAFFGQAGRPQTDVAGLPTAQITSDFISARLDAHVAYPGATILKTVVHPEGPTLNSFDGSPAGRAYVEVFMATSASAAQVRDWYKTELATRHYTCFGAIGASYMYTDDGYIRGNRELLVVGYIKSSLLAGVIGQAAPSQRTVFETDYIINPAADAVQQGQLPTGCYLALPPSTPSSIP